MDKWSAEVKMELEPGVEISVSDQFKDEELIKPADKKKTVNIFEHPPKFNNNDGKLYYLFVVCLFVCLFVRIVLK